MLIFIASVLIVKPAKSEDGRNEKEKLGVHIFISSMIVQVIQSVLAPALWTGLVSGLVLSALVYIFYKIFVNSLDVIMAFGEKQAFSVEEVIGASLLVSVAFSSLSVLTVYGLSLTNILSIVLILFLGWKNGVLAGATAGITIGMVVRNNNRRRSYPN